MVKLTPSVTAVAQVCPLTLIIQTMALKLYAVSHFTCLDCIYTVVKRHKHESEH